MPSNYVKVPCLEVVPQRRERHARASRIRSQLRPMTGAGPTAPVQEFWWWRKRHRCLRRRKSPTKPAY